MIRSEPMQRLIQLEQRTQRLKLKQHELMMLMQKQLKRRTQLTQMKQRAEQTLKQTLMTMAQPSRKQRR
jgi:hypothetical protein